MKAFPVTRDLLSINQAGMDLRDYFAAKAMQAIVSTVPHLKTICVNDCAEEAYLYADAMMKVREK